MSLFWCFHKTLISWLFHLLLPAPPYFLNNNKNNNNWRISFVFLSLSLSLTLCVSIHTAKLLVPFFFSFYSLGLCLLLFCFSEPKEAVKIVLECGPDASVAVKHRSPVARQRYRLCDLVAAISGGVVFRLPICRCDRSEPPWFAPGYFHRRQCFNVVFVRGVWSERREKRRSRSHRFFLSSLIPYIVRRT